MKEEQKQAMREQLIKNTVALVAKGGFEKATTRGITHSGQPLQDFNMNEVYIYRLFGSKEKLYATAFCQIDRELSYAVHTRVQQVNTATCDRKSGLHAILTVVRQYVLEHPDHIAFYAQYYHSVYCPGEIENAHVKAWEGVVNVLRPWFRPSTNVDLLLHGAFLLVLDYFVRSYWNELTVSGLEIERVCETVYSMLAAELHPACV